MDDELRSRYRRPEPAQPVARPIHHPEPRPTVVSPPRPVQHSHNIHKPPENHVHKAQDKPMFEIHNYPAAASHTRTKRRSGIIWKTLAVLIIVGGLAAGGYLWAYPKYFLPNPFPANIQTNADMSLFYPKKLPAGYIVDKSSIHIANGAVIYDANNGSRRLVFTAQKTPPSFDFNAFYKKQFKASQDFTTEFGEVVIGKNDNRYLGSLVANNTWLLLSTNSTEVSQADMSLVMHNLKKY